MPFIISLIILLIVVGLALWLIEMIPMDGAIKSIIRAVVVVVVAVVIYLLYILVGYLPSGSFLPQRRP